MSAHEAKSTTGGAPSLGALTICAALFERTTKNRFFTATETLEYVRRLFQRLTVSIRPLRVEELAKVLAIQLEARRDSEYDTDWRPEDAQQAVLSACSSLITVVNVNGSSVVQLAHFSVKEFLTSDRLRLSAAGENLSRYYVFLCPAHTVLAQACFIVLLSPDESVDKGTCSRPPYPAVTRRGGVNANGGNYGTPLSAASAKGDSFMAQWNIGVNGPNDSDDHIFGQITSDFL
ncbi:hypothetical protein EDB85DRAFT_2276425 [Lactarius pseudohatsudake]|nr:hypothetical protein EDB85DRAFT_2276425 [Lactarius pseudohatsudake]